MKPTTTTATTLTAAEQLAALRTQMKTLRDAEKAAREAKKGETVAERRATAVKYIEIFAERANRLEAKAKKARSLAALLTARVAKIDAEAKKSA